MTLDFANLPEITEGSGLMIRSLLTVIISASCVFVTARSKIRQHLDQQGLPLRSYSSSRNESIPASQVCGTECFAVKGGGLPAVVNCKFGDAQIVVPSFDAWCGCYGRNVLMAELCVFSGRCREGPKSKIPTT
jgi:hypothetical protein